MSIGAELGQYCLSTQLKNSEDSMGGGVWTPLWVRWWAYLKLQRVDSRLKLTFGQLVSKSTHHVWHWIGV